MNSQLGGFIRHNSILFDRLHARAITRALTDSEDEGIVDSQSGALRLGDVEIVALCVRSWVPDEEFIGGVSTLMDNWERDAYGVGVGGN